MQLELSAEERDLLVDLLSERLGGLRAEIYRTEAFDFKQELKVREELLNALLERLGERGAA